MCSCCVLIELLTVLGRAYYCRTRRCTLLAIDTKWAPNISPATCLGATNFSRALSAVSRVARGPPVPGGTFGPGGGPPSGGPPQAPKSAPWGGRGPPRPRGPEKHRFYDNLHRKSGVSYRKNRVFGPPRGPPKRGVPGGGSRKADLQNWPKTCRFLH